MWKIAYTFIVIAVFSILWSFCVVLFNIMSCKFIRTGRLQAAELASVSLAATGVVDE